MLAILVLAFLASALLALGGPATAPSPWGEMLVKHKWNEIPDNWVTLGHLPNGTTIDLHIALKPQRENALIDALHEVSQPGNPKQVLFTTPLLDAYSCVVSDMVPT
jgi:tripeptidyl-peptidase-1